MILFDTNVVIDARDSSSANHGWSVRLIEEAVAGEGGGINAVTLAELCAGSPNPEDIEPEIRKLGLEIFDLPAAVSEICGAAYRRYVLRDEFQAAELRRKFHCRIFSSARTRKS